MLSIDQHPARQRAKCRQFGIQHAQVFDVSFDEQKVELGFLEQLVPVAVTEERSQCDERRSQLARDVPAAAGVGVYVQHAPGPGPKLGEPSTEIRANQVVLDPLERPVLDPIFRVRVREQ